MNAPVTNLMSGDHPKRIADFFPRSIKPSKKLSSRDEHLDAARELVPSLRQHALKTIEGRQPACENVHALVKAGLIGVSRPKRFGGAGLELSDQFDVGAILAEGDASLAWDYIVWEVHSWLLGMLPPEGQEEVFGSSDVVMCSGVFNPFRAKARAVDGGYMVSGMWNYGSGSTHANWLFCAALVEGRVAANGRPENRLMVIPRESVDVLDTWRMRGLSGTGSHDISVPEEIFVPEHRTITRPMIDTGDAPGAHLHDGDGTVAYRFPGTPGAHLAAAATSVGAARGAIAAFKDYMSNRVYLHGQKQTDLAAAFVRIGEAEIQIEAAQLLFQNMVREIEGELRAGRQPTTLMRAKARMVSAHVPAVAKKVVYSMLEGSGSGAMAENSILSSYLNDVTTMGSHISTQYDLGPENYGRVVLGLEPSNPLI
jgi:alkylation response protein AidB-like acyl-CoA dehydrogenase